MDMTEFLPLDTTLEASKQTEDGLLRVRNSVFAPAFGGICFHVQSRTQSSKRTGLLLLDSSASAP